MTLQYGYFIPLLLHYPPNSAYIDAIRCCELVARAASGTTSNRVHEYHHNVFACQYHEMYILRCSFYHLERTLPYVRLILDSFSYSYK